MNFRVRYYGKYLNPPDTRIDGTGEVRYAHHYVGGITWIDITADCTVELISDFKDRNLKHLAENDTIYNQNNSKTGIIRFENGAFFIDYGDCYFEPVLHSCGKEFVKKNILITGTIHDKGCEK